MREVAWLELRQGSEKGRGGREDGPRSILDRSCPLFDVVVDGTIDYHSVESDLS